MADERHLARKYRFAQVVHAVPVTPLVQLNGQACYFLNGANGFCLASKSERLQPSYCRIVWLSGHCVRSAL